MSLSIRRREGAIFIAIIMLIFVVLSAGAQTGAHLILEYADDIYEIDLFNESGNLIEEIDIGAKISLSYTVRTYSTSAEFRLNPNGSIIRMRPNTILSVDSLGGLPDSGGRNSFSLLAGKIRMVAAASEESYLIRTPSTAAGVRGTDFVADAEAPAERTIAVFSGAVDVFDLAGKTIKRVTNETTRKIFSEAELNTLKEEFSFRALDPALISPAREKREPFSFTDSPPAAMPSLPWRDASGRTPGKTSGKSAAGRDKAGPGSAESGDRGIEDFQGSVSVSGIAFFPLGEMARICGTGFGGGAEFLFKPSHSSSLGFGLGVDYIHFPGTAPAVETFATFTAAGILEYRFAFLPFAALVLQIKAGTGYSKLSYSVEGNDPVLGFHPYAGAGAGLEAGFGMFSLRVLGHYRVILEDGFTPYHGAALRAGIGFKF